MIDIQTAHSAAGTCYCRFVLHMSGWPTVGAGANQGFGPVLPAVGAEFRKFWLEVLPSLRMG